MRSNKTIFLAKNISELLYQIKNVSGLEIVGGCTSVKPLPEKTLSSRDISELKAINMRERFIDFGPAVTLNEILALGKERVPQALFEAAKSVGNFFVRNMATLGGNICASVQTPKAPKRSLYAPLLALGATLKFRNTENQMSATLPFSKFEGVPPKQVLVSVRVPADDWDVSIFRRVGKNGSYSDDAAAFCFLAKTASGVLTQVKMVFAGPLVFFDSELEAKLLGVRLPLSSKTVQDWTEAAALSFDKAAEKYECSNSALREELISLARYSLNQLT